MHHAHADHYVYYHDRTYDRHYNPSFDKKNKKQFKKEYYYLNGPKRQKGPPHIFHRPTVTVVKVPLEKYPINSYHHNHGRYKRSSSKQDLEDGIAVTEHDRQKRKVKFDLDVSSYSSYGTPKPRTVNFAEKKENTALEEVKLKSGVLDPLSDTLNEDDYAPEWDDISGFQEEDPEEIKKSEEANMAGIGVPTDFVDKPVVAVTSKHSRSKRKADHKNRAHGISGYSQYLTYNEKYKYYGKEFDKQFFKNVRDYAKNKKKPNFRFLYKHPTYLSYNKVDLKHTRPTYIMPKKKLPYALHTILNNHHHGNQKNTYHGY